MTKRYSSPVYICARICDETVRPAGYIFGAFDNQVLALVDVLRWWCDMFYSYLLYSAIIGITALVRSASVHQRSYYVHMFS